jgi:hypothetical protein
MAKRAREQAVRDKRARKQEKKQAVREAKAAGIDPWAERHEGDPGNETPGADGPDAA